MFFGGAGGTRFLPLMVIVTAHIIGDEFEFFCWETAWDGVHLGEVVVFWFGRVFPGTLFAVRWWKHIKPLAATSVKPSEGARFAEFPYFSRYREDRLGETSTITFLILLILLMLLLL